MEYNPYDKWRRIAPDERARQFMPFAALRGYYDLIREAEYTPEPRRPHTEEPRGVLRRQRLRFHNGGRLADKLRIAHHPHRENHHPLQRPMGA